MKHTKHSASSKAKAKAPVKKPVPAKAKAAVKKAVPVKKAAVKKPVAAKPVSKKTAAKKAAPLKKAAPKKAAPKKVATKKVATKKALPAKKTLAKKPAVKKSVPPSKAVNPKSVPAKKAVTKTSTAARSGKVSVASPKTSVASQKSTAKTAPSSVTSAAKSPSQKNDKSAAKSAVVSPARTPLAATAPTVDVAKKSPRAAKAMAMMPPPPGQSVASTSAKSSYGPMTVPSLPAVVPVVPIKNPKLANNWRSKTPDTATDEEVIAMSDDDYMNAFQMAFFRHKLVQLKTDILVNAGETTEHLREDTVIVPDPADRATIEEEHALELRTRDRERKLLKKIEQSIARIDSGDYGYCDETGEPIGVGRLIARPTATLSLEAQQRRELKQKMFGD